MTTKDEDELSPTAKAVAMYVAITIVALIAVPILLLIGKAWWAVVTWIWSL